MTNDVDSIFYPGVSDKIPEEIKREIQAKLEDLLGISVKMNFVFMRLSVSGVDCPHEVHTDASMGNLSLMLYLNRINDCLGGTSFVRHVETGATSNPVNEKQMKVWKNDCNNFYAWQMVDCVEMFPNRGVIFDASKFHRALPVGGFGKDAKDGRLVLTVFFDADG
jgi:hypothetical protein